MNSDFSETAMVNIVMASDKNYAMQMGVAMFSVVRNLNPSRRARFFLLVSGWSDTEKERIRLVKNCEIHFIEVDDSLLENHSCLKESLPTHIQSLAAYYRFFIPDLVPSSIEKVLYLDVDLVADADVSELYDLLPNDKLLGAVPDLSEDSFIKGDAIKFIRTWDGYKGKPYFNSGVLLLNVRFARDLQLRKQLCELMREHPHVELGDQTYLNYVCGQLHDDKMVYLPIDWNVSLGVTCSTFKKMTGADRACRDIEHALHYPKICHFTTNKKPWIAWTHPLHKTDLWIHYYRMSPFADTTHLFKCEQTRCSFLGLPFLTICSDETKNTTKGKLFGLIPLYSYRPKKFVKIEPFKILLLKIRWATAKHNIKVLLFGFIPVFSLKSTAQYK